MVAVSLGCEFGGAFPAWMSFVGLWCLANVSVTKHVVACFVCELYRRLFPVPQLGLHPAQLQGPER